MQQKLLLILYGCLLLCLAAACTAKESDGSAELFLTSSLASQIEMPQIFITLNKGAI